MIELLVAAALTPWRLDAGEAIALAERTAQVRSGQAEHETTYLRAYRASRRRWRVSLYVSPGGEEEAQVYVSDRSGAVLEAWAGVQARWPMARGYGGQFGRAVNTPWIWAGLSVLFLLPFLRGPPRMLHLDLAVLLAFGVSYAFFNAAEIGISVPTVYPLLAYLLARMLWIARRPPDGPGPLLLSDAALLAGLCFLIGVRIALNLVGNVIDVGQASVIGAGHLLAGEPLYGGEFPPHIPHGDTYGPVMYAAYAPFELVFGDRAAGHAAALAFDLGCIALLWRLGGLLPAYLWAAFPFTLVVSASGANDALGPLLVMVALLAWRRPAARGALAAVAGLAKLAPLALAPLLVGRKPAALIAFAVTALAILAPFDPATLWERTVAFQAGRDSPFSIWGDVPVLQALVQAGAAALAVAVAFVPRRRDTATVCALAAAVLIAAQLGADHWFYLYLVWFAPLAWLALLNTGSIASARRDADARISTAISQGSSSAAS